MKAEASREQCLVFPERPSRAMSLASLKDDERYQPMFYATFSLMSTPFGPQIASSAAMS
jgi:hypothetical protein